MREALHPGGGSGVTVMGHPGSVRLAISPAGTSTPVACGSQESPSERCLPRGTAPAIWPGSLTTAPPAGPKHLWGQTSFTFCEQSRCLQLCLRLIKGPVSQGINGAHATAHLNRHLAAAGTISVMKYSLNADSQGWKRRALASLQDRERGRLRQLPGGGGGVYLRPETAFAARIKSTITAINSIAQLR